MWLQRSSSYKFTENHSKQNQELNVSWIIDIYIYYYWFSFMARRDYYITTVYIYICISTFILVINIQFIYHQLSKKARFLDVSFSRKSSQLSKLRSSKPTRWNSWQPKFSRNTSDASPQGAQEGPGRSSGGWGGHHNIYIYIYIIIHDRLESYIVIYNHI